MKKVSYENNDVDFFKAVYYLNSYNLEKNYYLDIDKILN